MAVPDRLNFHLGSYQRDDPVSCIRPKARSAGRSAFSLAKIITTDRTFGERVPSEPLMPAHRKLHMGFN